MTVSVAVVPDAKTRGPSGAAPASATLLRRYFAGRAPQCEIDDLVQDVFVRFHSARPAAPILDLHAYLLTIARHVLVSRHRGRAARCATLHDPIEVVVDPATEISPERIVAARQDCARALAAVDELPPRARAAFELHRFENLTYAAIATRMNITRDSVKELLRRANVRVGQSRHEYLNTYPPYRQSGASIKMGGRRSTKPAQQAPFNQG